MNVDRQKLLEDGYLIFREVVPPELLDDLRENFEELVHREWPEGPNPGRPPWQPQLYGFEGIVDEDSAGALEFCMHENVLGASRQLFDIDDAGLSYLYLLCNPSRDYGPWFWHRDCGFRDGPLQGKQQNFIDNGPVHLQWNMALYDDDVLWVVPGSHVRPNTDAENTQMASVSHSYANGQMPQGEERHTPLRGSRPVELKAGDGVVYSTMILHWGSNYSTRRRRCIHIGTRSFGGPRCYPDGFCIHENFRYLSSEKAMTYDRLRSLHIEERETKRSTLQAIVDKDAKGFSQGLARLHPAESGRLTCLIDLCGEVRGGTAKRRGDHAGLQ